MGYKREKLFSKTGNSLGYAAYTAKNAIWKGGNIMYPNGDPYADLDDLLFEEEDGGPSER